jgi:predicted DNA-binding transcriptional regulator AlpA
LTLLNEAPPEAASSLLSSAALRRHLGDVSEMTIWRWTRDKGFPRPDVVIARRKFWRRATVEAWLSAYSQAEAA